MTKSKTRTKSTGEIFTPPELVDEIVDKLYEANSELFSNKEKIFLDPACGDGEFLRGVIRKFKKVRPTFTKKDWKYAIEYQLLGVDLMWDNVCDTVYYLLTSYEDDIIIPTTETITKQPPHDNMTPDEINENFIQRNYFIDDEKVLEVRKHNNSNHYVEYNRSQKWVFVENIVRANSLTEWDFKNWCPKENQSKQHNTGTQTMNKPTNKTRQNTEKIVEQATKRLLDEVNQLEKEVEEQKKQIDDLMSENAKLASILAQIHKLTSS